jgi:hypothetical protein
LAKRFQRFLEIDQSESRIGCGDHHCSFRPDPLTNMATTGDFCFSLADFNNSSLKLVGQMYRNSAGSIYGKSSVAIAYVVLIR